MVDIGWALFAVAPVVIALALAVTYGRSSSRALLAAGALGSVGFAVSLGLAQGVSPRLLVVYLVMGTIIWCVWATYVVVARKWMAKRKE